MNNTIVNLILNTDSYKPSHFLQLPEGTTKSTSYIESRGCDVDGWNKTTFYGLQMFLMEYMSSPITVEMIDEAEAILTAHGEPFNRAGWEHILNNHGGKLPLRIQAVPEGTNVELSNVLVQVTNTDEESAWLVSYVETALLRAVWYPTTVASQSMMIKRTITKYLEKTSDVPVAEQIGFKLHDFGARGVSSMESAGIGGSAHLVHFMGTDTVSALLWAKRYYGADMAGFSIPASEHSTMTSWGGEAGEIDAFENMLDRFLDDGRLVACVSDSYNISEAMNKWYKLKDKIIGSGGTLVVRPDSGVPEKVVVNVIRHLIDLFGADVNSKGYLVLPSYLRVIQGDGIDPESIERILDAMEKEGLSADNIAFGMGGGMLQHPNRDTFKFAMKACENVVNGEPRDVFKTPVGDASKVSKKGRQALVRGDVGFVSKREEDLWVGAHGKEKNYLRDVWVNGELLVQETFDTIRERAASDYAA